MLNPNAKNDLTDSLFNKISRFVYEACGINLTPNKRELVQARLGKIIRERGFKGFRHYYEYMTTDETGQAISEVLNAVSTNLTSFFRESQHFDFLADTALPEITQRAQQSKDYTLRGWSAGCSMGAEAYTIALTMKTCIPDLHRYNAKLLATDIDTNVLDIGRRGIYPARMIDPVPKTMLHKYFQTLDGKQTYQIDQDLRRLISFRFLNLMHPFPFKGLFDFIFCRNVMIYFDRPTQQILVEKFTQFLKPRGYLFIGHSEGLSGIQHSLRYVRPTIYQKS